MKKLDQGHTDGEEWGEGGNPGSLEASPSIIALFCVGGTEMYVPALCLSVTVVCAHFLCLPICYVGRPALLFSKTRLRFCAVSHTPCHHREPPFVHAPS